MLKRYHIKQDVDAWLIKDRDKNDEVVERCPTRKSARVAVHAWNAGKREPHRAA